MCGKIHRERRRHRSGARSSNRDREFSRVDHRRRGGPLRRKGCCPHAARKPATAEFMCGAASHVAVLIAACMAWATGESAARLATVVGLFLASASWTRINSPDLGPLFGVQGPARVPCAGLGESLCSLWSHQHVITITAGCVYFSQNQRTGEYSGQSVPPRRLPWGTA